MNDKLQSSLDSGLAKLPPLLRDALRTPLAEIAAGLAPEIDSRLVEALPRVLAGSDFVKRALLANPALLAELIASGDLAQPYAAGALERRLARSLDGVPDETELKRRLRIFRRRETVRVAFRDLAGLADLAELTATLSALADGCIAGALRHLYSWAKEKFGVPVGAESGDEIALVVLGMGKLGGRELNFSSDVDLIFAYAEEGETRAARALSNQEFFLRLGQSLVGTLSAPTEDGFVFRVDMRLRPDGASGPLALCFDAMEQYYQIHGRDWERYALIKARAVGGDLAAGESLLAALKPFVFRKYLDYGAFEAIRGMKTLIEREMTRDDMRDHVKLGPGGIREIEFIGQAMQLMRAGREPALQCRPILETLARLAERKYLPASACEELSAAYVFLRNVEHRLQMVADEQTHLLPTADDGRTRLAFTMGFSDWTAFEAVLEAHRRRVRAHFTHTFILPGRQAASDGAGDIASVWLGDVEGAQAERLLRAAGFEDAAAAAAVLEGFRTSPSCHALSADGRARLDRLMPLLIAAAAEARDRSAVLARLVHLLEAIGRRTTYFVLLAENPTALTQLVKLCEASAWIASWIAQYPIVLDELLDPRSLYQPLTYAALAEELRARMSSLPEDDLDLQMEVLRQFHHSHLLRVAAADIATGPPAERVGAQLVCIADAVMEECLAIATRVLTARHGQPRCPKMESSPGFAVIGYGKLGSLELGYASDLDMIFLYQGCEDGVTDGGRSLANEEFFARLGQRFIHLLTARTRSGVLYEVDMRLRPSGGSGTLVTSLAAFRDYQLHRAWTWEHQALVRARAVTGEARVKQSFDEIRQEILCQPRETEKLKRDVAQMRARMEAGHPAPSTGFNLKHSRGGIVDIEFMVQYWTLRWAHQYPVLTRHRGNISILDALHAQGLLESPRLELLAGAYRRYLGLEQKLKLAERGSVTDAEILGDLPQKVLGVWNETFN